MVKGQADACVTPDQGSSGFLETTKNSGDEGKASELPAESTHREKDRTSYGGCLCSAEMRCPSSTASKPTRSACPTEPSVTSYLLLFTCFLSMRSLGNLQSYTPSTETPILKKSLGVIHRTRLHAHPRCHWQLLSTGLCASSKQFIGEESHTMAMASLPQHSVSEAHLWQSGYQELTHFIAERAVLQCPSGLLLFFHQLMGR